MKTKHEIDLKELDEVIRLCKDEQAFRVQLTFIKWISKLQLEVLKQTQATAKRLSALKQKTNKKLFATVVDKDLEKEVKKMINKSFKGGVLK